MTLKQDGHEFHLHKERPDFRYDLIPKAIFFPFFLCKKIQFKAQKREVF